MRRVNNLVARFYRAALNVPLERFRPAMLKDLGTVVPFDAALWGVGDPQADRFHGMTLLGFEERFTRRLERTLDVAPAFGTLASGADTPLDVAELLPESRLRRSALHDALCQPFDIRRMLGARYRDSRSGLQTLVVLFRFGRQHRFEAAERGVQRQLVFHVINAMSVAYSVFLDNTCKADSGQSAGLCDRFGVCHDAQPAFMNLLSEHFPEWDGYRLPFDLPEPDRPGYFSARGLQIALAPVGDMVCVRAWREGPMDLLTERERQIVASVCRGLSYKEVARPLGIAPSTVSNHLYRVYGKLGVTSRNELAKMVGGRQLH